jgi:hypothetical protein
MFIRGRVDRTRFGFRNDFALRGLLESAAHQRGFVRGFAGNTLRIGPRRWRALGVMQAAFQFAGQDLHVGFFEQLVVIDPGVLEINPLFAQPTPAGLGAIVGLAKYDE